MAISKGTDPGKARDIKTIGIVVALCAVFILAFGLVALYDPDPPDRIWPQIPRKIPIPFGFKFQFYGFIASWTDITLQLSAGAYTIAWANLTAQDLTSNEKNTTWHYGHPLILGSMLVWLNVTDLAGDGRLNNGDAITFTTGSAETFSENKTYTMTLLYEPTDGSMLSLDFTG
jgi:hypothetical protein